MNGLVEQGPVYVKGYKVGIVEKIEYDFSREEAFVVHFSTNTDIDLPEGTVVALVPDGFFCVFIASAVMTAPQMSSPFNRSGKA